MTNNKGEPNRGNVFYVYNLQSSAKTSPLVRHFSQFGDGGVIV